MPKKMCPLCGAEPVALFELACDRCDWWLERRNAETGSMTEEELHELADHSRLIFTRPEMSLNV